MARSLMSFAFLALAAFAVGCSSDGTKPIGKNGQNKGDTGGTAATAGLVATPWCTDDTTQEGVPVQTRYTFRNGGAVTYTLFERQGTTRGIEVGSLNGTWSATGDQLTIALENAAPFTVTYVYNARGAGGVPTVTATGQGRTAVFTSCN